MGHSTFEEKIARYGRVFIEGIPIYPCGLEKFTEKEALAYVNLVKSKYPKEKIEKIVVKADAEGMVSLDFTVKPTDFQRIRRITGYLVGDLARWGDAKRAEEHDRVKHM